MLFSGQPIDSPVNGPAPLPWDIPLQPPQMFSDFKTAVEVPHTANIKVRTYHSFYIKQCKDGTCQPLPMSVSLLFWQMQCVHCYSFHYVENKGQTSGNMSCSLGGN